MSNEMIITIHWNSNIATFANIEKPNLSFGRYLMDKEYHLV